MTTELEGRRPFTWSCISDVTQVGSAKLDASEIDVDTLHRVANTPIRPTMEVSGEQLFLALTTAKYVSAESGVELGDVIFALSPSALATVCESPESTFPTMHRGPNTAGGEAERTPLGAFHLALEMVIDNYVEVIELLDRDIRRVEGEVFSRSGGHSVEAIYRLRRSVTEMERATTPLTGEPLSRLLRRRAPGWVTSGEYGDTIDADGIAELDRHLHRVVSRVQGMRSQLDSMLDANLTQVNLRQNADMRKISAWVAIASVPTLVAGIYGMNFDSMPELTWAFGYPFALTLMSSVATTLHWRFKKNGWL
ncbi:hypothetical protein CH286_20810 [Rhodococcus sp. WWJCD1]|uniref:CorA family divalent cation transporter n=1 Tax=Rhodococcus sp. WWJCD1 TaxID=2022519 RepID=UPI000B9B73EA|nr:CorA family divalent cation transporter [Rhodococcus sp. WWJCD1]OZC44403.1 hypothetical protein CH286_20810 [Rhodococcus sp. WWJCD1]